MGRLSASMIAVNRQMPSSRASCQAVQQGLADATALPGLKHGNGDLRAVAPFIVPDITGDAHASTADRVHRHERLVVAMVDFREIPQLRCSQAPAWVQEAAIHGVAAALLDRSHKRRLVARSDRSDLELPAGSHESTVTLIVRAAPQGGPPPRVPPPARGAGRRRRLRRARSPRAVASRSGTLSAPRPFSAGSPVVSRRGRWLRRSLRGRRSRHGPGLRNQPDRPRRKAGPKTRTPAGPSILIPAPGAAGGKLCVKFAPLTSEVVQHLQGRRHALIEKPIGEVAVGQCPGELQGADHQPEDRERVRPGGLDVCRVQARGDVVDLVPSVRR